MSLAILDLNDAGIDLFVDGELRLTSPGYAVMDGDTLLIGEAAANHSRLLTRWSNHRFWEQLGTQPLPNGTRTIRHHADLALAHLEEIRERIDPRADDVILAVPAGYDREQLGLLIAIARESGLAVRGVVEAALAATAIEAWHGRILHLDIQLHRIRLSMIDRGVTLRHADSVQIADLGLHTLHDRWAHIISTQFIQSSRFDPMHEAASEQALYSRLPRWLEEREADPGQPFSLALAEGERSVLISGNQLSRACDELFPLLVQQVRGCISGSRPVPLCITHRWRGFPGLRDALRLLDECRVIELPRDAVCQGVVRYLDQIRGEGEALTYVTSLTPAADARTPAPSPVKRTATHLLLGNHAFPILGGLKIARAPTPERLEDAADPQCTVYLRGKQAVLDNHAGPGTLVNGTPIDGEVELHPGDRLTIGESELVLISSG